MRLAGFSDRKVADLLNIEWAILVGSVVISICCLFRSHQLNSRSFVTNGMCVTNGWLLMQVNMQAQAKDLMDEDLWDLSKFHLGPLFGAWGSQG